MLIVSTYLSKKEAKLSRTRSPVSSVTTGISSILGMACGRARDVVVGSDPVSGAIGTILVASFAKLPDSVSICGVPISDPAPTLDCESMVGGVAPETRRGAAFGSRKPRARNATIQKHYDRLYAASSLITSVLSQSLPCWISMLKSSMRAKEPASTP